MERWEWTLLLIDLRGEENGEFTVRRYLKSENFSVNEAFSYSGIVYQVFVQRKTQKKTKAETFITKNEENGIHGSDSHSE